MKPALCTKCRNSVDVDSMRTLQQIDSRFLRAGCTLNNDEGSQMNQSLEEDKRRLWICKDEIAQTRQRLSVLEEEERSLESNISKRRFALEIWPSVPTEIWEIIFTMVCTPNPKNRDDYHSRFTEPALIIPSVVLSHVCPRWRAIVLGSPRLWTNIHIAINGIPRGAAHLVRAIIKRSEGRPLDIHLSSHDLGPSDHALAVWEVLLESSSRWKSLVFDQIDLRELTEDDEVPVNNPSFPNLISFESSVDPEYIDENDWFWAALYQAPKLQTVETEFLYPPPLLPYARITSLTISQFASDDEDESMDLLLFEVLPLCKKLCHLTLDFDGCDSMELGDTDGYPVVQFPCLRSLKIQGHGLACSLNDSDFLQVLFASLRTPALDSFHLQCSLQALEQWPEFLLAMLERSPSLQHLCLWFIDYDDAELQTEEPLSKILAVTPNLTHFEFRMIGIFPGSNRDVLYADGYLSPFLSHLRNQSHLLPNLEYLSLLRDYDAPSYIGILRDLLRVAQSRVARRANSRLKTVQLRRLVEEPGKPPFTLRPDLLEEIHSLKQDGVSVVLEDLSSSELYDW
ncbi:hypothetical protein L218DRAFT_1076919 [Marasmius fiardii PR-910]|nr:hypothetical protein L218DRAFT_1076919 [Marasmius fiardii PR-910]